MARNSAVPERERAMDLLLAGWSPPKVAKEVGVGRTTLWRWSREPDFVAELRRRRQDRRELVQTALVDSALEAVAVLREVMTDRGVAPAVRVRAAEALLSRVGAEPLPERQDGVVDVLARLTEVQQGPKLIATYSGS